ncbi:Protein suppressor of forked [Operophtera brumata]|uniref:Protein suppressor of forked n=1 Tax=Operophtera brumata TaxID=104452 RepID=A0A0L7KWF3_OPEBR|nr:Protein suppressor of forked [Operophtera brumata]
MNKAYKEKEGFSKVPDWGNERLMRAQRAVESNLYDVDSWSLLIREAQTRTINDVRSIRSNLHQSQS